MSHQGNIVEMTIDSNSAERKDDFQETTMPDAQFEKEEVVRVILKSLEEMGFTKAATVLEEESGFILHEPEWAVFAESVREGRWAAATAALRGLRFASRDGQALAKFAVAEEHFLELLEDGQLADALEVLQQDLAPCQPGSERIEELAGYLLARSPEQLRAVAHWPGVKGGARDRLLKEVKEKISPSACISDGRLQHLFLQAQKQQILECPMHTAMEQKLSLYADHKCQTHSFPSMTQCVLECHTDEVWHIVFSPNGEYLASTGSDKVIAIWEVKDFLEASKGSSLFEPFVKIQDNQNAQHFLCWCPDNKLLLSCSEQANTILLWDITQGGIRKHQYEGHKESVSSLAWSPTCNHFVSGSLDRTILFWDIKGNILAKWDGLRVNDLGLLRRNSELEIIALCAENRLRTFGIEDIDANPRIIEISDYSFVEAMIGICVAEDGKHTLLAAEGGEIRCWNNTEQHVTERFSGHRQGRFVLRPCFGGHKDSFVLCGSEDSQIYIWHRLTGKLITVLPGHSGTVNSVAWNSKYLRMFASASDDTTIRVWLLHNENELHSKSDD